MKNTPSRFFRFFLMSLLAGALIGASGCRRTGQDPDSVLNLPDGGSRVGTIDDDTWGEIPFEDAMDRGDFLSRTPVSVAISPVYFAFDSYRVAQGEMYKVQQAVDHLRTNPSHVLVIEGHTDERGSREYNLALGERRALAVRETLVGFGISPQRIQTLSFGEEQPAVMGQGESVWSQNRRAEFRFMR